MNSLFLYKILSLAFKALYFLLLARVLMSWIPHDPYHPIARFLHKSTDWLLRPFQDLVPTWKFGIDVSPLFAFFALWILEELTIRLLF